MTYTIKGKDGKNTKVVESLKDFLNTSFVNKGERIGYANFVKAFANWNNDKTTVNASTMDLHKAIFTACYQIASFNKSHNIDLLPIFTSDKDSKVSVVSVVSVADFDKYYGDVKAYIEKPKTEPTLFIMNYITKHETEIDFSVLKDFMKDFD